MRILPQKSSVRWMLQLVCPTITPDSCLAVYPGGGGAWGGR
jgi:hypothetical protein